MRCCDVQGSKFAVKGWKLRAPDEAGTMRRRSPCSSTTPALSMSPSLAWPASSPCSSASVVSRAGTGTGASGGRPGSMSLRESLAMQAAPASGRHQQHQQQRVGPPPVPYGGGGPPNSLPGAPVGITTSEEEMRLQRCSSLLRDRHDRGVVEMVLRDVVQRGMGVTFDDIAALSTAKRLLNEAIVLPLMMPEFFTGIREPWKVSA